jgi:hypothetical protein
MTARRPGHPAEPRRRAVVDVPEATVPAGLAEVRSLQDLQALRKQLAEVELAAARRRAEEAQQALVDAEQQLQEVGEQVRTARRQRTEQRMSAPCSPSALKRWHEGEQALLRQVNEQRRERDRCGQQHQESREQEQQALDMARSRAKTLEKYETISDELQGQNGPP